MAKRKVSKGSKVSAACLEEAKNALNLFDEQELKEYTIQVFKKAREYEDLGGEASLNRAMQEVNKEHMDVLLSNATIKANNTLKFEKAASLMKKGGNLVSFLHKSGRNYDHNVESVQRTTQNDLYRQVFGKMSKEQETILISGKHEDEIFAAMDGVKSDNPEINAIADIIKDYPELIRNPEIVKSNALPPEYINPDRKLRNYHDPSRVASAGQSLITRALSKEKVNADSAKLVWREDIKRELDLDKTFGDTDAANLDGTLNMKEVDRIIDKSFNNIVQEKSAIFTKSVVAKDREAVARSRRMFYHFKDWRAWGRYNKKYGKGTLHQALMSDIHSSSNQIGLAKVLGDSPETIYNDLRHLQEEVRPLPTYKYREADMLFKQVRGLDKTSWSPTMANIGAADRVLSGMSRLGSLVLNSLGDISQVGGIAQRFGYGFWKPYVDGIVHAFDLIPVEGRAQLARMLKSNLDVHMGYMGRFVDATNMGEMLSKVSNTFYWANFTNAWDRGLKLSAASNVAKGLGRDAVKGWNALRGQTRSQLEKFSFTEHEWDGLRAKTENKLFTTDNVDALSDKELHGMWEKSDKLIPLSDYRDHLYRKVYGLFDTVTENAVLDPRAYERMITTWNLPPGTYSGEAVRMVMQFKSYPIANFRRVWYGGMKDMDSAQAKFMYALNMASGNFMLGYLGSILGSYAKGLTPPDPAKMSYGEKTSFFAGLLAPGMGTFLRVLDPRNQNSGMLVNTLVTPSVRLITDPLAATFALATGHPKQALKDVQEMARYALPISTIPAAEPFLDSLMGKKPYMQPGQKPLF